jgi:hypothetical protein
MNRDIADIRLENVLLLYTEFLRERLGTATDARRVTLEGPFAQHLRISASYWSQLKSRNRHIGETLARQFERLAGKPPGWLDAEHSIPAEPARLAPENGEEAFLVGLLLTCYRMNPPGVKQRMLELMEGELARSPRPVSRKQRPAKQPELSR